MSQINAVENPIINTPYSEPQFHWHIEVGKQPDKRPGRRPASYFFRVPERAARGRGDKEQPALFDDSTKGQEYLLDNANLLRERVAEWRRRDYSGATRVTRELLALWRDPDRTQKLFYAQLEAVETVLFMVEGPNDLKQGIRVPMDEPGGEARKAGYKSFLRYALKMATGTGKTTVMGMLAAWSILNKVNDPQASDYSDTVLIICPNITIRDRLRELDPNQDELSLYRQRELVPAHRMPELRRGEVMITNWHHLERREMGDVNGTGARVVKRGVPVVKTVTKTVDGRKVTAQETKYFESDAAFLKRVLGNRKGRGAAILVMNDEAHHAYRRGEEEPEFVVDDQTAETDAREATVWIEGLDRINKVLGGKGNGIRMCVDLSATPFFIQGSGNEVGKPFPWVVSDFSLLEAIEAGLVKIPQLPTQDGATGSVPAYFNVWRWVQEQSAKEGQKALALTPATVMRYATAPITQLAQEWKSTHQAWHEQYAAGHRATDVPPVFIVVCRDTSLAKALHGWLAEGDPQHGPAPADFLNAPGLEYTIRVDSKVGEEIASGGGKDEARRLRFVLETIGKTRWPGNKVPEEYAALVAKHNQKVLEGDEDGLTLDANVPPGRDVRCIISVAMLSEGWDATTVTHVVGLRPFGSQLLCEQVVGRALRRTSYAVDEATGLFREETAKVFGVPFELIPFKVEGGAAPLPSPPANHVFAVPGKAAFEIEFPLVDGYANPGITRIAIDWAQVPTKTLDTMEVPDGVLMQGLASVDGSLASYGPGKPELLTLAQWRAEMRPQRVAFTIAGAVAAQWRAEHGDSIPMHRLFPQLLAYVQQFMATKLVCKDNRTPQDLAINPYFQDVVGLLFDALTVVDESGESRERPIVAPGPAGLRSTGHVSFHTGKPLQPVQRCHLNAGVFDSQWEKAAAFTLDTHEKVRKWVRNDRLGLVIPYRKSGVRHRYLPDFLVVTDDDTRLVVEIKGQLGDGDIKAAAALRWCKALNNDGRFGAWRYVMLRHPGDLAGVLANSKGA